MLQYLSIFGVGALVATIVQFWLTVHREKRLLAFNEKKEAFVGLLEAYHQAAVNPSVVASKNFAYWQIRCELVGSSSVVTAIQSIIDSNENHKARCVAHENLKRVMKRDLGIAGR
ncbi:MAG: hypothetical protein H0S85_05280 [Desulfovibrionaceae bacterium]|nr:hypothetical protein [Desulfovibrionaceae bacterium]